jgi:iron complex outermembrane receptor protein
LNIYLNQGKGFETPTLAEAAYTLTAPTVIKGQFNPNLLASRSKHLELGTKWQPSSATRVDAAWFQIKTDNEIVTARSANGQTAFTNASKTVRDGFELSLRNQHNAHWRSQVSGTVMNATYDQAFSSVISGTTVPVAAGNSLPAIPKQQLFASLQWSEKGFSTAGQKPALGTEFGIDWINRSSMWASDTNSASDGLAPGYSIFNARVRQRYQVGLARVEAFVGIDNLTDKSTVSSVIVNQGAKQYFEPGLPRNWVVGLTSQIPL